MKILCIYLLNQVERFWGTHLHPSSCGLLRVRGGVWHVGYIESIFVELLTSFGSPRLWLFFFFVNPLSHYQQHKFSGCQIFIVFSCFLAATPSSPSFHLPSQSPLQSLKMEGVLIRGKKSSCVIKINDMRKSSGNFLLTKQTYTCLKTQQLYSWIFFPEK